jgi:ligand-binding sensor domain-containing protein/signal transduction histidine kinase
MFIYQLIKLKRGEYIIHFVFLCSLFMITSCSQNSPIKTIIPEKKVTLQPPLIYKNKSEIVTLLDTCPKPVVIALPQKPGGSYSIKTSNGDKAIHLLPPVTKAAGFYVAMQHYGVEDGLPLNDVPVSYCDKDGNVWFGTYGGGVSRYDGKSFTNLSLAYGLEDDQLFSIYQDKNGNMWFGTWDGIVKYDGKSFRLYSDAMGMPARQFRCTVQDKNGNMWFGTGDGLWKYNDKSIKNFSVKDGLPGDNINCMLRAKDGNMWLGTDTGLSRYDGNFFKNYTIIQGLADNRVKSLIQDKDGYIWVGTNNGISEFDGDTFKNFTTAQGLVNNHVTSLLKDKNNHLWIGTDSGASEYDGHSFKNYTVSNGLSSNLISSMVEDKNENIWFTSAHDGVCRYSGNAFISYNKAEGLSDDRVNAVCQQSNGMLWYGTDRKGAIRFDGKSFTSFNREQGMPDYCVNCIYEDKSKNIWFGTFSGVSCFNGKSFTNYTTRQGLGANTVWSITQDKTGNMWFATYGGSVSKLSSDKKTITNYVAPDTLATTNVNIVFTDSKGNIWFGYNSGGGASVYDGNIFKNYQEKQGLTGSLSVSNIFEDKNKNIWFAVVSGVCRYDGKSFMNFTTDDGLPDELVISAAEDKNGMLWFGSRLGFSGLKFKAAKEGETGMNSDIKISNDVLRSDYTPVFENYNFKNGYPVRNIAYFHSMYVDTSNILWAGTGDKLIRFDHNAIHKNLNPPYVIIENIKLHNERIPWYDLISQKEKPDSSIQPANIIEEVNLFGKPLKEEQRNTMKKNYCIVKFDSITPYYYVPVNLVLPYNDNDITFDFAAIETARPNMVRYQYMLEGYDRDWSPVTDKASATFGNMHEGDYTFKLKAKSADEVWSSPVIYTFKILPPLYRSWWAYTIYIIAFITAIWSFIRWRISVLKREKILLEKKVYQRTEQLKNSLEELKSTQAQLIQSEKMASLGELTAGIAHEIQNPLNFVNNFSEINKELVDELQAELKSGNVDEAMVISNDIKENEGKINQHGKRADSIVKGMLQHTKTGSGKKELTDINKLGDEYLKLAYHGFRAKEKSFNAALITNYDESVGSIKIVAQDVARVLLNIYNNAFYAVNEKAKQELLLNYEPAITVTTKKVNDKVEISIKDNGNGIPQKVIDKIFQPFFTTKPTGQGTGLGLSMSYDIIKAHGGEIKVNTKENEGSEFIFELPIKQ